MSRGMRSAVAAVVVLLVLGLLWPQERNALRGDSFGTVPAGHRAVFELLSELGVPVGRSYTWAAQLPPDATVWWIEPWDLCLHASATAVEEQGDQDHAGRTARDAYDWDPEPWLRAGGTALVFLPSGQSAGACEWLGPYRLPRLTGLAVAGPEDEEGDAVPGSAADPEDGDALSAREFERWWNGEEEQGEPAARQRLEADWLPRPREIAGPPLARFEEPEEPEGPEDPFEPGGLAVRARLDGAPFVIEHAVGDGRLLVFADGRFLRNAGLDRGDAAPLAVDLVRAFGTPRFDERAHGLRTEQRPHVYLARSRALPVFAGVLLLGGLALWRGNALPRRSVPEADPGAPELERFVDSLAALYARSRDHDALARRTREVRVARLRRSAGLSPDTPAGVVVARLRALGGLGESEGHALLHDPDPPIRSAAALRAYARRLDALGNASAPGAAPVRPATNPKEARP